MNIIRILCIDRSSHVFEISAETGLLLAYSDNQRKTLIKYKPISDGGLRNFFSFNLSDNFRNLRFCHSHQLPKEPSCTYKISCFALKDISMARKTLKLFTIYVYKQKR